MRTDVSSPNSPATDFAFTGQRNLDAQGNVSLGLMDYNARMYDSLLARFIQPDSIISGISSPQTWNRYSYVRNDPIGLTDPTGHHCADEDSNGNCPEDPGYDGGSSSNGEYTSGNPIGGYEPTSGPYPFTSDNNGSNSDSCGNLCNPKYSFGGTGEYSGNTDFTINPEMIPGINSQPDQLDPLQEFSIITGITPRSLCNALTSSSSDPLCNPNTYNINLSTSLDFPTPTPDEVSSGLDFTGTIDGIASLRPELHYPIVGYFLDTSSQLAADNGKGYTFWQEASRVVLNVAEGQVSANAGLALAGGDGALAAPTGLGDVIIIGGSYVLGSSTTSAVFHIINEEIIKNYPQASPWVP